jgi:hypothetical protein
MMSRHDSDIFFRCYMAPQTLTRILLPLAWREELAQLCLMDRAHFIGNPERVVADMVLGKEVIWVETLGL